MSLGERLRQTCHTVQRREIANELYDLFCWETLERDVVPVLEEQAAMGNRWWETKVLWDEQTSEECLIQAWKDVREALTQELSKEQLCVEVGIEREENQLVLKVKILWD